MVPQIVDQFGRPMHASAFNAPAYRAADFGTQELAAWNPRRLSADSAILPARDLSVARVNDLLRNDPHAGAGVARIVDMLVGARLILSAKPNARALGFDPQNRADRRVVRDLGQAMETEFRLFAEDHLRRCDAQRKLSLNGIFRLLGRQFAALDEATAFLTWKPAAGARYATAIRVIDPDRLSNPDGAPDSAALRGGIAFDADGAPLGYYVRAAHASETFRNDYRWEYIPRATAWGRPVFIHGFEPDRADQSRAMSKFASLVQRLRMVLKHGDLELANAAANALYAAFVKSNLPIGEATQVFTPQATTFADRRLRYWSDHPPTIGGVRIPVLPLGDEIQINGSPRQTTAFPAFQAAFLQSIAAGLGISYEQLAMDWSKVNYSSARAALNEVWRHIQTLFAQFVDQVVCPIHYAVIEEAFDRGHIKPPPGAPAFWDMPQAYLRARWIGPGRGYVDPTKEAEAASMRMDTLTSTLEDECAEQGRDVEDVLDQRAVEAEEMAARNVVRLSVTATKDTRTPAPETQTGHD